MFLIKDLINCEDISSGVYNISDDQELSTNELIHMISEILVRTPKIWYVPSNLFKKFARFGDFTSFPLNTERLQKLTETYLICNQKIVSAIGKPLPIQSKEGLIKKINTFNIQKHV